MTRTRDFGHGDQTILRDPAAHPELQARIPAQDTLARPAVIVFERVGDDIGERGGLAVRATGIGSSDAVVLRLPVGVEGDVGEVQEIGFEQVGVEGRVDGVATFTVGAGAGGEKEGEESECSEGGHGWA